MKVSMKELLNKLLNWSGLKYTWDIGTNNTTDTWVPVFTGNTIQHRVIPTQLNSWASNPGSGSSQKSTTGTTVLISTSYTPKTNKIRVAGYAQVYVNTYTGGIRLMVGGSNIGQQTTNNQNSVADGVYVEAFANVTPNSAVTVQLVLYAQSGATAYVPAYRMMGLTIHDV